MRDGEGDTWSTPSSNSRRTPSSGRASRSSVVQPSEGGRSLSAAVITGLQEWGRSPLYPPYRKISWGCARIAPVDRAGYAFVTDDGDRSAPGKGLINGLAVTLKTMTRRTTTQQYPDVEPDLPPRSRGVIALLEENCTVCMLCARECPDWCIYIDSHKEEVVVPGAARARQRNVLDRFDIDFSLCMYCGICIEVCPFDALYWTPEFEYSELDLKDLLHEKGRLGEWMQTVPPPPAHDPMGEPAKE